MNKKENEEQLNNESKKDRNSDKKRPGEGVGGQSKEEKNKSAGSSGGRKELADSKSELISKKKSLEEEIHSKREKEKRLKKEKLRIQAKEKREDDPDKKKQIERERWEIEDKRRMLEKEIWNMEDEILKIHEKIKGTERKLGVRDEVDKEIDPKEKQEKGGQGQSKREKEKREKFLQELEKKLEEAFPSSSEQLYEEEKKETKIKKNKIKKKSKKKKRRKKEKSKPLQKPGIIEKIKLAFKDLFPITRRLFVGVDISDHSIEIMLLKNNGAIASYGRTIIGEGAVKNGKIMNPKGLSKAFKETLKKSKPQPLDIPGFTIKEKKIKFRRKFHKAIISLPDSKTYIQTFELDNKRNLYGQIGDKIQKTIPFDPSELYWSFVEIPTKGKVRILCVAAQRSIIDLYIYFLKSANIEPVAFEVEGVSIGRALLPIKVVSKSKRKKKNTKVMADGKERMIIDMGARTSIINIFNKDAELIVSVSLPYAGHYLTKKLAEHLDVSKRKAEEVKQSEGFKKDGKAFAGLKEHGEKIVQEIKEANKYYSRKFEGNVEEIVLTGGTALLPDIDKFLNNRVEPEVKRGDPLKKIRNEQVLKGKDSLLYSNVIGLALKSLEEDPINDGINLLPEEVISQAKKNEKAERKSVLFAALFIMILGLSILGATVYYFFFSTSSIPQQTVRDSVIRKLDEMKRGEEFKGIAVVSEGLDEPVNIYEDLGAQAVVGEVKPGTKHEIIEQNLGWVKIRFEDGEGWIEIGYLEEVEITEVQPEEEQVEDLDSEESEWEDIEREEVEELASDQVVEISSDADAPHIRELPEPDAPTLSTVEAGATYRLLEEEEGWVMIEVEEERGWISKDHLKEEQEEDTEDEDLEEEDEEVDDDIIEEEPED